MYKDPEDDSKFASTPSTSGFTVAEDEDPIWNTLTSSCACRETGFEPGPSGLSGELRQYQQSMKLEHDFSSDTGLDITSNLQDSPQSGCSTRSSRK